MKIIFRILKFPLWIIGRLVVMDLYYISIIYLNIRYNREQLFSQNGCGRIRLFKLESWNIKYINQINQFFVR